MCHRRPYHIVNILIFNKVFVHFIAEFESGQNGQLVVTPNRLHFMAEEFERRLEQALRSKKNLAISNIIIDHFSC